MKSICFLKGLKFVALAALLVAGVGAIIMFLWNHLVPDLFGLRPLHWGQAIGLLVLSRILFGGFHGRHGMPWRRRLQEKWEQMTPAQREKFRAGIGRCCRFSEPEVSEGESSNPTT